MRFTLAAISLAGAASVASASTHRSSSHAHSLAARSVDVSVHKNDPRTLCLINGLLSGILGTDGCGPSKPSYSWKCSGSGHDGYDYDPSGKTCPSQYPAGWKYFGVDFGWLPPAGWSVPHAQWQLPSLFIPKISICKWWAPPTFWVCPPSINPPSWWPQPPATTSQQEHPPATTTAETHPEPTPEPEPETPADCPKPDWQCDESGNDGWDKDYDGKTCPYQGENLFDSNGKWKFFGSKYGWQPEERWNIPHDNWSPPSGWTVEKAKLAVWWVPGRSWRYPSWWSTALIPVPTWPDRDNGWCGWLQPTSTPTSVSHPPPPPPPSPTATAPTNNWPSKDWTCDNSGNDGKDFDWQGNKCPYSGLPFKWFGVSKGWLPVKGWWGVSIDFQFPSAFLSNCGKASWWAPSSSWKYPVGFSIPGHWISLGWKGYNWPSTSWTCDKSGRDGWEFDVNGHGRPSWCPSGWLYFGAGPQWQPPHLWGLPSSSWSPPSAWNPQHAPWWRPNITWKLSKSYSCPSWWPVSLIQRTLGGLFSWFGW